MSEKLPTLDDLLKPCDFELYFCKRRNKMSDELKSKLVDLNDKLSPEIRDDCVIIIHPEFRFDKSFSIKNRNTEDIIEDVNQFLKIKYTKGYCLYYENHTEFLISLSDSDFADSLVRSNFIIEGKFDDDIISYEVGYISDQFFEFIDNTLNFDYSQSELVTLKIYNVNKILKIRFDDEDYSDKATGIAKSIIFEISYKTDIYLKLLDISAVKKDEEHSSKDLSEHGKLIDNKILPSRYDKDLIQYYYRAIQMIPSEFQYLAFYQVLECIFDEVFLSETIQDLRRVIESSWFNTNKDENMEELIKIFERYSRSKNDREKTRIVLDKYFKGQVRKEAYYLSNRDITNILKKLKKIKKEDDLNDLQKLADIIYDYRCKCTHSNRAFPFRTEFQGSSEELEIYISLIKKIAEKIIINYHNKES